MYLGWNICGPQLQEPRMGQSQTASENLPKKTAKHSKSGVKVSNLKSSL